MNTPNFKKKIKGWIIWFLFLLGILIAADYLFVAFYKSKLPISQLPREKLTRSQSRFGYFQADKRNCFVNFPEEKRSNIIRLGCFGDSFTHCDEVNDVLDYPSLLQKLFHERGFDNIEVINFGQGGYGFNQAFILWEFLGKKYDLDYLLLGPCCFQFERDCSFNWSLIYDAPARISPFSPRYILRGDGVELIDLIGASNYEIALHYFKFMPYWRYLRYEYIAPLFLSAPTVCLFPHRQLRRNPFYYKLNLEEETKSIYRILLRKMSQNATGVILGNYEADIVELGRELKRPNLHSSLLYRPVHFPYLAFGNHNSPCGNMLVAQQMFDCWVGKKENTLDIIMTEDIEPEAISNIEIMKHNLSYYKEIAIEINDVKIGRFYEKTKTYQGWGEYCKGPYCEPTRDTFSKTDSLLFIKNSGPSILDGIFVPLEFELEDRMPLVTRIYSKLGYSDHKLGTIELLNKGLNIGIAEVGSVGCDINGMVVKIKNNAILTQEGNSSFIGNSVDILLAGYPILSAKIKKKEECMEFSPTDEKIVIVRGDGREILDIDKLSDKGTVYLALYQEGNKAIKIPFARWLKEKVKVNYDQNH